MSTSDSSAASPLRHIALEGADNLRDIGGFPATDGQVRWKSVYRSDSLSSLTSADLARLEKLNLRAAFDAVAQDYGGMAAHTREALGVSDATVAAMRQRLII